MTIDEQKEHLHDSSQVALAVTEGRYIRMYQEYSGGALEPGFSGLSICTKLSIILRISSISARSPLRWFRRERYSVEPISESPGSTDGPPPLADNDGPIGGDNSTLSCECRLTPRRCFSEI